jgi:hypothetical protein
MQDKLFITWIAIRKFPDEVEHTIGMKSYTGNKSHDHNAPWINITPPKKKKIEKKNNIHK